MAPISSRRCLLAATTAVVMGSGITAGAAASVADLVPVNPDADLIRLCAEFDELERQFHATDFEAYPNTSEGDRAEAEQDRISAAMTDKLDEICGLPVQTLDGAKALARTMKFADTMMFRNVGSGGYHNARFVAALVGGLVGWPA